MHVFVMFPSIRMKRLELHSRGRELPLALKKTLPRTLLRPVVEETLLKQL